MWQQDTELFSKIEAVSWFIVKIAFFAARYIIEVDNTQDNA